MEFMVKVFLVEDNEMNCDMLFCCLICKGYEVVIVVDGEQVVIMVILEFFQFILMDMSLLIIDGWIVIK